MSILRMDKRQVTGPSVGSGQALGLSLALVAFMLLVLSLAVTTTGLAARPERVQANLQNCVSGPHSGTLVVSQTWCFSDSPHVLNGDVTVSPGVVLTVEAGVTVRAYDEIELLVQGRLEAVGTVTQPITFTSMTDSGAWQWSGLLFDGASAGGNLEHATVRYTGDGNSLGLNASAILVRNVSPGQVRIADSQVVDNRKGLWLIDSRAMVSHTLFSGVADGYQYPLEIQGAASVVTLTANTFTANPRNRVLLQPGAMMGADATLARQIGLDGYELANDFTVPAGVTLAVAPGVTVMAGNDIELKVQGGLAAVGTASQPITFTSVTNAGPAQWSGLIFDGDAASGDLAHVTVRYGGNGSSSGYVQDVAVRNVLSGQVRIADSQLRDCHGPIEFGLYVQDSRVTVSNTLFTNIGDTSWWEAPLYIAGANSVVTLTGNTFTGNTRDRVLLGPGAMMAHDATLTPQAVFDGYQLQDDFTVPAGRTLTVAPGVTVMADRGIELLVQGHLEAVGTPSQPITFTSVANAGNNGWTGLAFNGGTGHLDHTTVRYGGDGNSLGLEPAGIVARNVTAGEVRLEHTSLITACGFVAQDSHMSVISSTISSNGGVACAHYRAGDLKGSATVFTMTHSLFQDNHGGILLWLGDAHATFDHNQFIDNGENPEGWADEYVLAVSSASPVITLTNNLLQGNAGGLSFSGEGQATLINNAFIGQTGHAYSNGSALQISGNLTAIHNTFAHNRGEACDPNWCKQDAIWISTDHYPEPYRVVFTNTIIADHKTGVVLCNGPLQMDNTLWYSNTVNVTTQAAGCLGGVLTETGHLEGPAAFAADGYHLTCGSVALQAGVDAGVSDDIDGQVRPQPAGTMPDLGADESPCAVASEFTAVKSALPAQWIVTPDPNAPSGYRGQVRQRYAVNYHYYSSPAVLPPLDVAVTDTLPVELTLAGEDHQPAMDFQQQGQQLTWQTQAPVQAGEFGWMWMEGVDDDPLAGEILANTAELQAGDWQFDLEASTTVPLFAPFLASPQNGETCIGPVPVRGLAQPGVTVQVLDAASNVITETVADAGGAFTATFFYPSDATRVIKARACVDGQCSVSSRPVTLTPQQSFLCPQTTSWEVGDYTFWFRDQNGWLSTQDFRLPTIAAYNLTTTLQVVISTHWLDAPQGRSQSCSDPFVWATYDGQGAILIDKRQINDWNIMWEFAPHYGYQNPRLVCIKAWCDDPYTYEETICGRRLTDPDGYIFDVTRGLDVGVTTVAGVTVTCMMSSTEWGGWVPWPAQWYMQKNPQVTGVDGYFAFFTPPGLYYVQVEGIPGYQAWRSPAAEVISQVVHVNVPYTPWPVAQGGNLVYTVTLTADGPDPAVITVPAGSSVAWVSTLRETDDASDLVHWTENPILRPLSALDPISYTLGWDGGMLAPGHVYRRQFPVAGSYDYSDGAGHSGVVVVRAYVYLPLVVRKY
jgi:hypothetical protein